ncbi:MAG: ATP synthase F1 subunit gamma [Flavobacteriaceae bacterium]|jgi:F-type H+-transporting ATPase subunit gamma|nr:ATP synthase F1 subunit gamma [Flavobacteriaceae bacterium]
MANLKEIRNRISSVGSTMQITSAMKMVSAAKLKKAQDAIVAMRPYAETLSALLQNLSAALDGEANSPYTAQRPIKKVLAVVITSNRGLAGAFNSNVVKEAKRIGEQFPQAQVDYFTLGKKGNDAFKKSERVVFNDNTIFDDLNFEANAALAEQLMDKFKAGEYDKIVLIYNKFKNAATQIVMNEDFLPLEPQAQEGTSAGATDFIFEPSQEEIVAELIPKSLKTQLFKALRDSVASEHGARMTAMHKATDNAKELKNNLTLEYNKARQAAITNEILEIVGGAEALAG